MIPTPGPPGEAALAPAVQHAIADGVRLFDSGAYWHAHEAWELAWRQERGTDRHYLKGLIQFAAALHHWQRGKHAPAARLLSQAQAHLHSHAGERWPFHTSQVLQQLALAARQLQLGAPAPRAQLHPAHRPGPGGQGR
jgi:predicted metal-dependent hydrolase